MHGVIGFLIDFLFDRCSRRHDTGSSSRRRSRCVAQCVGGTIGPLPGKHWVGEHLVAQESNWHGMGAYRTASGPGITM